MNEYPVRRFNYPLANEAIRRIAAAMLTEHTRSLASTDSLEALLCLMEHLQTRMHVMMQLRAIVEHLSVGKNTLYGATPPLALLSMMAPYDMCLAVTPCDAPVRHYWIDEDSYDPTTMQLFHLRAINGELRRL